MSHELVTESGERLRRGGGVRVIDADDRRGRVRSRAARANHAHARGRNDVLLVRVRVRARGARGFRRRCGLRGPNAADVRDHSRERRRRERRRRERRRRERRLRHGRNLPPFFGSPRILLLLLLLLEPRRGCPRGVLLLLLLLDRRLGIVCNNKPNRIDDVYQITFVLPIAVAYRY